MMYHFDKRKGFFDGRRAVEIARQKYPQIKLNLFGVYKTKQKFPDWITYDQKPTKTRHNDLYNKSAIFIAPSHAEGFGLTPAEAMQCGCAVACTNTGGYKVFCQHNKTALVSPVGDSRALADNIIKLIENPKLRIALARNGNKYIQRFTWERAYKKLKKLLTSP
jgi:glycosyltransferase involved in cell wall biosynthesis